MDLNLIQKFTIWILPALFAITVHEAAHGYAARYFGDDTAARLGRLSLNPLRHIDPIGTVLLPIATFFLSGFIFGWAKPVPVDARNLRNPRRDMAWVSLAGPGSNLVMAIFWGLMMALAQVLADKGLGAVAVPLALMGQAGVFINLLLMLLNLVPIPPLDGGRILISLLPPPLGAQLARIEPFGLLILILLLVTGVLWAVLGPLLNAMNGFITGLFLP
ncbi:site-2 protease family protein [Thiofaba sp. EF100]|jgi:Zn-dependent protease|uniref:site-2 protease family protein n=1 Tax=Thiofaba sp. EF100 TaxID=3121274 RepID=UPI003221CC87